MNIAFLTHYYVPEVGAPSARVHELARAWVASGHRVEVVTCFPNHPTGVVPEDYRGRGRFTQERIDGVDVYRTWTYVTPNRGFVKKTVGHLSYLASSQLQGYGRVGPFDVVIGTSPTLFAALAACLYARRRRVPFVMDVRDLWPAIFVDLGIIKNQHVVHALEMLELSLYRAAARVVTVTESFRQNLIDRGIPPAKVVTIPNGADTQFFVPGPSDNEVRREHGWDGRFVVLYIGAHGISHALHRVLDVAEGLQHRKEILFAFVGDGAEKEGLCRQAKERRLDNVEFLPSQPKSHMPGFYQAADICLVPLRDVPLFRTFIPSKMFEIMACARPIVASVAGEARAILEASGSAIVVDPEDARAITAAIESLTGAPERRSAMGAAGREFVQSHYGRSELANKYEEVLRAAVEGTPCTS